MGCSSVLRFFYTATQQNITSRLYDNFEFFSFSFLTSFSTFAEHFQNGFLMRKLLIPLILACATVSAFAQDYTATRGDDILVQIRKNSPKQGKITLNQDPEIERVFNLDILQNARQPGMHGYRIRIYFDLGQKSRKQSEDISGEFMQNYPGISVYRSYVSPYYKVSVGDFRTRDNALKLYHQLTKDYPKAFIVPEWVNFPPLE